MLLTMAAVAPAATLASSHLSSAEPSATDVDEDVAEIPEWASSSSQPKRTVIMNVRITGDPSQEYNVSIDYRIQVTDGDDLVDDIRDGNLDSSELAEYLCGGPANTPATIDKATENSPATVKFRYTGNDRFTLFLGDSDSLDSPAASSVNRILTVAVENGVITEVSPYPDSQSASLASFLGTPEAVYIDFDADTAAADEGDSNVPPQVDFLLRLLDPDWAVWIAAVLAPWMVVLWVTQSSTGWLPSLRALRRIVLILGVATIGLAVILQTIVSFVSGNFPIRIASLAFLPLIPIVGPVVLLKFNPGKHENVDRASRKASRAILYLGVASALSAAFFIKSSPGSVLWYAEFGSLILAGLLGFFAADLLFGRWAAKLGIGLGLISAAHVHLAFHYALATSLLLAVIAGLGAAISATVLISAYVTLPRWAVLLIYAGGVVLYLPPAGVFDANAWVDFGYSQLEDRPLIQGVRILNLLLAVGAVALLRNIGQSGRGLRFPAVTLIGLVAVLVTSTRAYPFSVLDLVALLSLVLGWWWIFPKSSRRERVRLSNIEESLHKRLITADLYRRAADSTAGEHSRRSRQKLATAEISWFDYKRRQRQLDDAADSDQRVEDIPIAHAQSTNAGSGPWKNGLSTAGYSTPVAAGLVLYEVFALAVAFGSLGLQTLDGVDYLNQLTHLSRWPLYGFMFGFFYPLLRGSTPVSKSLFLALAVVVAEIIPILDVTYSAGGSSFLTPVTRDDLIWAVLIRVGQVLVFFAVLGLAWERRIVSVAGYRWDRLRNVRSIRALVTPASTVLVAVATAAGTAVAGLAVAGLFGNSGETPSPMPSTSRTSPP